MMKTIFSGIQPTGCIHIGNYLGAIKPWLHWQNQADNQCYFCVVDLHALTTQPQNLAHAVDLTIATYLACGIDADKSVIYQQGMVFEHTQLAWLLATHAPMGWLKRMTQFKEKAGKKQDQANLGLFSYPVLMAADILLFDTTHVPVGEDQKQHLEFSRDLAIACNQYYNQNVFVVPEPVINTNTARIMSLRDGTAKMSKSDPSALSRIHLTDTNDQIAKAIRKAKSSSDTIPPLATLDANKLTSPEAHNLLTIYSSFTKMSINASYDQWAGKQYSQLKRELSELLIAHITPIRAKINDYMSDKSYLSTVKDKGLMAAQQRAKSKYAKVWQLITQTP
jgi:tryptophanyl-tRNA synthetase